MYPFTKCRRLVFSWVGVLVLLAGMNTGVHAVWVSSVSLEKSAEPVASAPEHASAVVPRPRGIVDQPYEDDAAIIRCIAQFKEMKMDIVYGSLTLGLLLVSIGLIVLCEKL